jgi:hypothetical protein
VSLDDLLPLLLVAFFIVNAFLRGGRGRRSRGQGAPPARPPRGRGQASTGSSAPADAPASEARDVEDVLAKRLEEARRRVQASTRSGSQDGASGPSRTTSPQSATTPSTPSRSATAAPQASAGPAAPTSARTAPSAPLPAFLGREGISPRSDDRNAPPPGFLGREGAPSVARRPPPRDARTRAARERSARLPATVGFGIDPDDVVRGIIWSEVLGPPLSARRRRRTVSRRRSH